MQYPFHPASKPVSGSAAQKLAEATKSVGSVVNERVLELMQRIAARRQQKDA